VVVGRELSCPGQASVESRPRSSAPFFPLVKVPSHSFYCDLNFRASILYMRQYLLKVYELTVS
jgi:hypothetical protein